MEIDPETLSLVMRLIGGATLLAFVVILLNVLTKPTDNDDE